MTLAVLYVPALTLLLVQVYARRPRTTKEGFPLLGLDAHVTGVALVMSVTLLVADSPSATTQLLTIQIVITSFVTALLAVTAIFHHDKKRRSCNISGVSFLVFAVVWVMLVTALFSG